MLFVTFIQAGFFSVGLLCGISWKFWKRWLKIVHNNFKTDKHTQNPHHAINLPVGFLPSSVYIVKLRKKISKLYMCVCYLQLEPRLF